MEPNTNKPAAQAFFINPKPIEWPVYVRLPVDGGSFAHFMFTGHFARLSHDESRALEAANALDALPPLADDATVEAREAADEARRAAILADNLRKMPHYLVGWSGVRSGPGMADEVPFSVEALCEQLRGPNGTVLAIGVWHATREIEAGVRLGNFDPSPAPGPGDGSAPEAPSATL